MFDSDESLSENANEFWVDVDHVARRVTIGGDLDLATVPTMVDAIATLQGIAAGDITLDLEEVTFIDAGAFGALVRLRAQQDSQHVKLRMIGSGLVGRIAGLCGLSSLIAE